MVEFKDNGSLRKLCFFSLLLGFLMLLSALATESNNSRITTVGLLAFGSGGDDGTQACIIVAILLYVTSLVLIFLVVCLDEVRHNHIVVILFIVSTLIAGVMTLVGLIQWITEFDNDSDIPPYSTTLAIMSVIFAIMAGIFAILDLANCGKRENDVEAVNRR